MLGNELQVGSANSLWFFRTAIFHSTFRSRTPFCSSGGRPPQEPQTIARSGELEAAGGFEPTDLDLMRVARTTRLLYAARTYLGCFTILVNKKIWAC